MKVASFLSLLTGTKSQTVIPAESLTDSWPLDLPLVQFSERKKTFGHSATLAREC